jgi:hypothetical protein
LVNGYTELNKLILNKIRIFGVSKVKSVEYDGEVYENFNILPNNILEIYLKHEMDKDLNVKWSF